MLVLAMAAGYMPHDMSWMFDINLSREDVDVITSMLRSAKKLTWVLFFIRNSDCFACGPTMKFFNLLQEAVNTAGKADLIKLKLLKEEDEVSKEYFKRYSVSRVPTILMLSGRIRYTGIPSGEEIGGFIETLVRVASGDHGLNDQVVEQLKQLENPVHVEVLVTPTCPYCPYAAVTANMFALAAAQAGKPVIYSETVELYENPDIATKYGVMSVPTIIINGELFEIGVPPEEMMLEGILRASRKA